MRKNFLTLLFLFAACLVSGQDVSVIKYNDFKKLEKRQNDTTYVINFWATWCRPCVQELPYFDGLTKKFEGQKVKVMLVSLDFIRQLNSRLLPFVKDNKLVSDVYLLDEPDYNSWIGLVDQSWSGAIPATLIINNANGVRKFYEKEFTQEELEKTVQSFIY